MWRLLGANVQRELKSIRGLKNAQECLRRIHRSKSRLWLPWGTPLWVRLATISTAKSGWCRPFDSINVDAAALALKEAFNLVGSRSPTGALDSRPLSARNHQRLGWDGLAKRPLQAAPPTPVAISSHLAEQQAQGLGQLETWGGAAPSLPGCARNVHGAARRSPIKPRRGIC